MFKRNNEDELIIKNKTNLVRWIDYKEKKILYIDYSNLSNSDEIIEVIEELNDYVLKRGCEKKILTIR